MAETVYRTREAALAAGRRQRRVAEVAEAAAAYAAATDEVELIEARGAIVRSVDYALSYGASVEDIAAALVA